jgi:predicted nucleic acid-binding protein
LKTLDTTIAVDHLRGRAEATQLIANVLESEGRIFASEIVRFELHAGMREAEQEGVADLAAALTWIPVEQRISTTAGDLARRYRGSHSGIDDADYLIAATALALRADVLTTNVRHFPMFPDLKPPY